VGADAGVAGQATNVLHPQRSIHPRDIAEQLKQS
jgi:hypothetical protein